MIEPTINDPVKAFRDISMFYGPNRYNGYGGGEINGGTAIIQPSPEFPNQGDPGGKGAIWGWFVGSPRAFLFGFERSRSWATRRMTEVLQAEFERCQIAKHQQIN